MANGLFKYNLVEAGTSIKHILNRIHGPVPSIGACTEYLKNKFNFSTPSGAAATNIP